MQEDGKWINVVPYGYIITNMKRQEIAVEPDEAEIVRKIFSLYNEGWGYKRIANYLTEHHIPTPRTKRKNGSRPGETSIKERRHILHGALLQCRGYYQMTFISVLLDNINISARRLMVRM